MDSKGSLPCSQQPVIGPYSVPDESSSQHFSNQFIYDLF